MMKKTGMIFKFFLLASATITISFGSYLIYKFNKLSLYKGDGIASIHESSIILEEFSSTDLTLKILDYIKNDQISSATNLAQNINKKITTVEKNLGSNFYDQDLKKNINFLKEDLDTLNSFPPVGEILEVSKNKTNAFSQFVIENKWKTLTRMSKRLLLRLQNVDPKNLKNLKYYQRVIQNDITKMENITSGSVLSSDQKNLIQKRLNLLKTEVKMLEKFIFSKENFSKRFDSFDKNFKSWIKKVTPEVELKKFNLQDNLQSFQYSIYYLLAILLSLTTLGTILYKRELKRIKNSQENDFEEIINKYVIGNQRFEENRFDKSLEEKIDKARKHVQKRMNFGQIFKEGLPFSTLVLDNNLQFVWGNDLLFSLFDLSNIKKFEGTISWDYLKKFTNLGDTKPINDALEKGMAGIYQIQIEGKNKSGQPYELYVTPVEIDNKRWVVTFFYPLSSMEDTLKEQASTLISPVQILIDTLLGKTDYDLEEIRQKFRAAGTDGIFEKFKTLIKSQEDAIEENNKSERELMAKIEGFQQFMLSENDNIEEQLHSFKRLMIEFSNLKNKLVSLSEANSNLLLSEKNKLAILIQKNENLANQFKYVSKSINQLTESKTLIETISSLKDDIKEKQVTFHQVKSELQEAIERPILQLKLKNLDIEKLENLLRSTKEQYKKLDYAMSSLEHPLQKLDLHFSKLDQVMEESNENYDSKNLRNLLQENMAMLNMLNGEVCNFEEDNDKHWMRIIENLKVVFYQIKENKNEKFQQIKRIEKNLQPENSNYLS